MTPRLLLPLSALLLLGALAGCGGGGSASGLAESRQAVRTTVEEVAASLGDTAEVVDAAGQWSVCSAGTANRLEYAGSLGLRAQGDPVAVARAVGERMREDGWEVTNEGGASVNLERDDMTASAKPSRANPGQVVVEVSGGCVDGKRTDVDSLESQPIDVA